MSYNSAVQELTETTKESSPKPIYLALVHQASVEPQFWCNALSSSTHRDKKQHPNVVFGLLSRSNGQK